MSIQTKGFFMTIIRNSPRILFNISKIEVTCKEEKIKSKIREKIKEIKEKQGSRERITHKRYKRT